MGTKKTFICPYCFEENPLSEVQFRCMNKRCDDCDDIEMTKYENGNLKLPIQGKPTFKAPTKFGGGIATSANCPHCGKESRKHVCPSCHNELPDSSLEGRDMIISIVGSRATGKSHFVGVIIKELKDRIAGAYSGSFTGFADSYARWQRNFGNSLYDNHVKLELTQSSLQNTDNGAYRPLIFKLKLRNKGLFKEKIDSFTFVFFDTAGEDLNDEDTMSTVNKYICKSAGIIFLLDPLQIPAVASQLDEKTIMGAAAIDPRTATKSDDIMTRVSNLIRNDKHLSETSKIDIPVAAVFSKFDAIVPLIPDGCTVLTPSPHCQEKRFNMKDWNNVNSEIQSLLHEWKADAFISQLELDYKTYSYFAASALGLQNNPDQSGRIQQPRPHRIEDPILWILKENGIIKIK